MKNIFIIIIFIFSLILPAFADKTELKNIQEYCQNCIQDETYFAFKEIIKGNASVSMLDKQLLVDKENEKELGSNFIYSDLENCIKIALYKNFDIKIRDSYKEQAYWQNKNALFSVLPNVYYNYDIRKLGGTYLVGGIVSDTTYESPIQSVAIIEWSIFNQGKYFFAVSQSRNTYKANCSLLEYNKDEIIRDTTIAYYNLLEKKMEMRVQVINLYDRLEQLKYTEARYKAGLGTLYDVKRAQSELASAQQDYTSTLNALRLRQAVLANIIGVNVLSSIYPFEISVDRRELVNPNLSIDELYSHALQSREDIKAKLAEINVYRAKRSSNYTDFLPQGKISYQNGQVGTAESGLNPNNSFTFDMNIPLGKNLLLGTITNIKADSALVNAKKLELVKLKRNIKQNIISYYFDSENALKKIQSSKFEVEAAEISLELALSSMKAGDATFIDVISSQNLKVQANINLIKNMIEYNRVQTMLLFETGLISSKSVLKDYQSKFY